MTIWKIWKYKLHITDEQIIELPKWSQVLSVGVQDGDICLWALVNPEEEIGQGQIFIRGTGHPCSEEIGGFYGTVMLRGGALVFHVFGNIPRVK